jgi:hypothetical protein
VGLGLSGIKSLDVLRDLPPLHASNSTSTTGSTAAVIIIQPITLSNVLTRLHSSRKFTGVDPQAYLTDVLTMLVNLWPAFDKLMPWAGAAKRCAHKLAAYQHLRPENQAVSTGGSEICLTAEREHRRDKIDLRAAGGNGGRKSRYQSKPFTAFRATDHGRLTAKLKILSNQSGRYRR